MAPTSGAQKLMGQPLYILGGIVSIKDTFFLFTYVTDFKTVPTFFFFTIKKLIKISIPISDTVLLLIISISNFG